MGLGQLSRKKWLLLTVGGLGTVESKEVVVSPQDAVAMFDARLLVDQGAVHTRSERRRRNEDFNN